ncbi:MAG TPA: acetyl-CoA carboxylase biotin carboxyl carrier protein [Pyrinomonadaceae bacterium]|jgi:acetyl-CoA carboxylase biotin carboxyl carrier protein
MDDQEGATQPAREESPRQQSQQSPRPQPEQQPQRPGSAPRNERERGGQRRGGGGGGGHQQNQARRSEQNLPMEELRDLFALFTEHGLTEFEIEREGMRVHLGRNPAPQVVAHPQSAGSPTIMYEVPQQQPAAGGHEQPAAAATAATAAQPAPAEEESLHVIISPIVGTFYRAPSPNAESFVRLGSHVDPDSVVCIIEAMKLMNEIQAETSGEIAKIYVENGQPVEYGQPLFGVKK